MKTLAKYVSKVEAQVVRKKKTVIVEEELAKLVTRNGKVTPALVVEQAQDPEHPLHNCFEWDDGEAARKFRLTQACAMILSSKFVCYLTEKRSKGDPKDAIADAREATQVRRYLPDFTDDGFRNRVDVLANNGSRQAIVERKIAALRSWCRGVVDIPELQSTRQAILDAIS